MFKSLRYILFLPLVLVAMIGYGQAPAISSFSPASGPVGTLVTINGTNLITPTAFSIGGVTALVINNSGTVLTGLVMPGAVTGAISLTTGGGIATAGGNFAVTPTPHPTAQQGGKLLAKDNTSETQQGFGVAISADGNTAIVGGSGDNNFYGATFVFTRNGSNWSQQGSKLVGPSSRENAAQRPKKVGFSCAVSGV